ncbi:MAG: gliding motility-associated C-terminal domain-containing protein [Bacteroidetes bacterium]|nr:gliding motility-associated C-terminal domain-containing protein [Bacteroidota bacterium]
MKQNYPKAILLTLAIIASQLADTGKLSAQCSGSVPSFAVDLTGRPDSMWISPSVLRAGLCCGATSPDVCIEFIITLDTGSTGFILDIYSGAAPGGSLYYSIGCVGTYPVGQPICLSGVGPHKVTFCKPGNNYNQYYIRSTPKPSISPDVVASQTCKQTLFVKGLEPDSVTWTSVPSNSTYNSYLSCTSGCDTVDVLPYGSFPSSVLYRGCGTVLGGCISNKFCDTVRVKFVDSLRVNIAPKNKYICFGDTSAILTATPSGGLPPYKYLWSNGKTTASITVGAGTYHVSLTDSMNCSIAMDTSIVNAYTMAILALPGNDTSVCSDQGTLFLNGVIQSAGGGKWSGSGTFSPSDTNLNTLYTFTNAEKAAGFAKISLATTYNNGCPPDTADRTIVFDPTPAPVISGPDSVCSNRTTTFSVTAIAGSSYVWGVTGGTITSGTGTNSIQILWGAAGTGTVGITQTSNLGCDSFVSKSIVITPTPAPVIAGPDSVCADKPYTYSVAFNNTWKYKWVVTGGTILGADNANTMQVRWAGPGSGSVKVTVTSAFGCDSSITKSTVIMPTPIPVIAGPATTCSNKIYSYSVSAIAGSTYQWSVSGGAILGSNNASSVSIRWGASGTGTLNIIQTSAFGCDSPATISVNIQPSPDPILVGPGVTCSNKIYTYSVTAVSGHTYNWSVTGGAILKGQSTNIIDVQWGATGSGTVTITQTSDKGCDSTLSRTINIQPTPAPVVSGPDSTCSNRIYTYSVTAIPGSTYDWIITRGSIVGSATGNSIRILWGADGQGLVSVKQTSAAGCDSLVSLDVVIMPTPNPSIAGTDNTCSNRVYTYSVLNIAGSKYSWQVNGGTIMGPSDQNEVKVQWGASGSGQVSITQTSNFGCDSTISKTINIMPTPAPVISGNGNVCSNRSNMYSVSPIPGCTYFWSVIGGKIQGSNTNNTLNVLWGASGGGQVQVKQTSAQGCDSTISISINIQPTPEPEIQGPDNVCSNRVASYSANFSPGYNYIWTVTGGAIQGVSNTYNVNVLWDAAGTGIIRVLESSPEGCDSLLQMPVNILPTPDPVITGNASPCQNKPYMYSVPVVAGHLYNWQVTYGRIIGSVTGNTVEVVWDLTGNGSISVTQTSPMGCDSTIKKTIQILPTPAPVIFGLANTCQDKTYKYAVSDIPGHTYLWSVSGGNIVGTNTLSYVFVKWGNAGVGVLTIRQVSNFGCDSVVSRKIAITTTPAPVINGPGISCQNYVAEYTSGTSLNGIGHFWRVSGGRIVGFMNRDTVRVAWDSSGIQWIQLTLTSPLGCDSTVTRNIQVNANPKLNITGPNVVCENHTYLYQSTYVADMAYIWTLNGGGRFSGNTSPSNIYVDMFAAGKYELNLKYRNSNGCEGSAKFPIQVVDFPIPQIDGPALGCANTKGNTYSGNTYSLVNKKGSPLKYEWMVFPAVNFSVMDETTISVDWGAPGVYTVALRQINTITGCDDTAKFYVEVDSIVKPQINSGDFSGCQPLAVTLVESTGTPELNYTWYLENGIVHDQATIQNTFTKVGLNPVKLVVTNKYGCKDSVKINVELFPKPVAAFDITSPAPYYSDDTINFKNKSIGAEYYLWDFADQEISYLKDPRHRFGEAIEHTVWLYAESLQGCRDSVSKTLRIMLKPQIFVPNAFTPGIDKLNDKFTISTRNIARFNILIYNRWGQIIFQSNQADFEWDGTYQSLPVMDGVYPYLINANGHQGERFVLTGEINVIR